MIEREFSSYHSERFQMGFVEQIEQYFDIQYQVDPIIEEDEVERAKQIIMQ